jgi:hypothetical protein
MQNRRHDNELHRQMAEILRSHLQSEIGKKLKLQCEAPQDLPPALAALVAKLDTGGSRSS